MAKPIGTLGTIETLTIGGYVFTNIAGLIVLASKGTTNGNCTLRKMNPPGSAGYAVTSGKTLTIYAISMLSNAAMTNSLLYADNDVGLDTATSFTNPVYFGSGSATAVTMFVVPTSQTGINGPMQFAPVFSVPATKYPAIVTNTGNTNSVTAYGYEA